MHFSHVSSIPLPFLNSDNNWAKHYIIGTNKENQIFHKVWSPFLNFYIPFVGLITFYFYIYPRSLLPLKSGFGKPFPVVL